jgi:hypothetical protein
VAPPMSDPQISDLSKTELQAMLNAELELIERLAD